MALSPEQRKKLISAIKSKMSGSEISQPKRQLSDLSTEESLKFAIAPNKFPDVDIPRRDAEELLPMAGQILGAPGGIPGSVAGATMGEFLRQGAQKLRGKQDEIDMGKLGTEAGLTTLAESIVKLPFKAVFKRAIDKEKLEAAGKVLGSMKEKLFEVGKNVSRPTSEILNIIDSKLSRVEDQTGVIATLLKRWKKIIQSKGDQVGVGTLSQFESSLNETIKFAKKDDIVSVIPKNSKMNSAGKQIRNEISKIVDEDAEKAGVKGFSKQSEKVANLLEKTSFRPGLVGRIVQQGLLGGAVAGVTGNPMLGLGVTAGGVALSSPSTRMKLFRSIGGNKAAEVGAKGLSELFRQGNREPQK